MRSKSGHLKSLLYCISILAFLPSSSLCEGTITEPVRQFGYGRLTYAAPSPDGTKFVTGSEDGNVRLWDMSTGKVIRTFRGHEDRVSSAAFSGDGSKVVTGSWDGTARLWDCETGQVIRTFSEDAGYVQSVAISPDGNRVLVGLEQVIVLWDAYSGDMIRTFEQSEFYYYDSYEKVPLGFSPDGSTFIAGELYDTESGELVDSLGTSSTVVYSPDGTKILLGYASGHYRLLDAETLDSVANYSEYNCDPPWRTGCNYMPVVGQRVTAFSSDGFRIFIAFYGGVGIRKLDGQTGTAAQTIVYANSGVLSLSHVPGTDYIMSGNGDNTVNLWNVESLERAHTVPVHFDTVIETATFSPDGSKILINQSLWDAETGSILNYFDFLEKKTYFTPEGSDVFDGYHYDAANYSHILSFGFEEFEFSHDQSKAAVIQNASNFFLIDWIDTTVLGTFAESDTILSLAFSPDDSEIVAATDQVAHIYSTETCSLKLTLEGHSDSVLSVAYSPDGAYIISGSSDSTCRIWNSQTGEELHSLKHPYPVRSASYSPDGSFILCSSSNTATLRDATSFDAVRSYSGHSDIISSAEFSPDGLTFLTASRDGTVKLWAVDPASSVKRIGPRISASHSIKLLSNNRLAISVPQSPASLHNSILTVYSLNGRVVKKVYFQATAGKSRYEISLSGLDSGRYLYQLKSGGSEFKGQFVVIR